MELKEVEPGEFGFFALERHHPVGSGKGPCINGWILLHWLLKEHCCVKTLMLPWTIDPKYQGLLSDALHLNSGLNKLTLSDWQDKGGFTDIISAISTLSQLKELDMNRLSLPPSTLEELGNAIQEISTLEILTLPSIEMDATDMEHDSCIAEFVMALQGCSNIAELSTGDYVLVPEGGSVFAEFVTESSSLRKLSLYHNDCYDEMDALFTAVGQNNCIEELHLSDFLLYEEQEQLLAKVVAEHTGLRHVEVGIYRDRKEWEMGGLAFADLVGQNTGLCELVFVGATVYCLSAFAEAVRKNTTLEKLTLGLLGVDVPDYRVFLEALACNQSLQLVTFEEWAYFNFSDIVLLMHETGTEGRLEINAAVVEPQDFESGLMNSTSLTKARYSAWHSSSPMPSGAFRHLLRHHHLQELSISLGHQIEMESATSLALFLSTTNSLRSATLEFYATAALSQILVEGIANNMSIINLSISFWTFEAPEADLLWHTLGTSKTFKALKLRLLDFGQVLDQVPDHLLDNHYLLEATIQRNPEQCRNVFYSGIRGEVTKKVSVVSTRAFQFGVRELLRRNLSTLHRAVQFVMGSRGRRFAEAFDRVSKGSTLMEALKKAIGESEDEIRKRIASCTRYLDEHFMVEAGVVRDTVVCGESSKVQLDRIGFDNWLHIRQYLKIGNIVLKSSGRL
ncbi:unnamed protein product, partial [Ixodes hexagonus]